MLTDAIISEILAKFEQQRDSISEAMPGYLTLCGFNVSLQALGFLSTSLTAGKEVGVDDIERCCRLSGNDEGWVANAVQQGSGCFWGWWESVLARAQGALVNNPGQQRAGWVPDARSVAVIRALVRIADLWLWLERQKFWWQRHPFRKADAFARLLMANGLAVGAMESLIEGIREQEEAMHCVSPSARHYWIGACDPNVAVFDLISKYDGVIWPLYQSARAKIKASDMSWLCSTRQAQLLVFLQDRGQADIVRQRLLAEVGQSCGLILRFATDLL